MFEIDLLELFVRIMFISELFINRSIYFLNVDGVYRILIFIEVERLNGFLDNWIEGMLIKMRYFCMGNVFVVFLIIRIGN